MQKAKHMAVVLGYEKWMQHHNGITADNFLEWKKLSREKGTDRQTDIVQNHMYIAFTKQF